MPSDAMNDILESLEGDAIFPLHLIESALRDDGIRTVGTFGELSLGSHFQPIFSLAHRRMVGFEALLRATDRNGEYRNPLEVFGSVDDQAETVLLDRMCRSVHLHNFVRRKIEPSWLFLNVNAHVISEGKRHGAFFEGLLERVQFPPRRVVIEILESELSDESRLTDAVRYYRDLGCLIAIDDFGAGHSNFDRIWRLRPDIVKFDRSIMIQAARDRGVRAVIPGMVSLVHEAGSLVVMEGIESELEALIAMDTDADFVQGYYFARPGPLPDSAPTLPEMDDLFDRFARVTALDRTTYRAEISPYINGLGYASTLLNAGKPLEQSCAGFLELPRAEHCFLLDVNGHQIGRNVVSPHFHSKFDPRYAPLSDASGANWSRRYYFQRAISQPEKVHVTRPYLSVASASPCVTASIATHVNGVLCVLCGDISWNNQFSAMDR